MDLNAPLTHGFKLYSTRGYNLGSYESRQSDAAVAIRIQTKLPIISERVQNLSFLNAST